MNLASAEMQIQYSANQPASRYNFPARVAAKEL
jgi:hypothetical protein